MSSLAEQLTELLDPRSKSFDPEDDIYEETKAKLVEKEGLDEELSDDADQHSSKMGGRRMQSLEGMGSFYRGKIVSRNDVDSDKEDSGHEDMDAELEEDEELGDSDEEKIEKNDTQQDDESEIESDGELEMMAEKDGMDEEIDSDEADGDVAIFKSPSELNPQAKGRATRNQLSLWENMLETRIKCQKLLSISNKLPQHNTMKVFSEQAGKSISSADKQLSSLLLKLLQLEDKLLGQNSQTQTIINTSDSGTKKRKSTTPLDQLDQEIQDRFVAMKGHRNKVLKLWYDKTRLTSTSGNSKSFSSFERSTVSQIEDILQDKERLLKRTQLKRSDYRILGTTDKSSTISEEPTKENHSSHLKEFNEEIFDDDDFYHQLLRQLIEQKASGPGGASDPVELTRQWLRIQRLRTKVRKNVDTKASKGRKIRYEIHQKLQSFMAPNDLSTFTHEARNQLFKSLFGNIPDGEPVPEH